jgi:hypothetical protein
MSREDLIAVAVRLFAVFLVILSVRQIPGVVAAVQPGSDFADAAVAMIVMLCVPIALAALLWFFPLSVAAKLLPRDRESRPRLSSDAELLLDTGLFLLGLWLLALGLSDAFYWTAHILMSNAGGVGFGSFSPEMRASVYGTVFEIAVALWILLKGPGIVGAIRRLREAGASHSSSPPPSDHD